MTGFEKRRLPHTQQQDTLFTIKRQLYTLINNSARYWCGKLPKLRSLLWLVSEAYQRSMSVQVIFKWLHLPWTSRQLTVFHHIIDCIQLLSVICGGENAPMDAIWLFLVLNVVLACHFMALRPIRMFVVLATLAKAWGIQLAIHSTVDVQRHYAQLQNHGEVHASVCFLFQDTILQIIKSSIPNFCNCAWKVDFLTSSHNQSLIASRVDTHTQHTCIPTSWAKAISKNQMQAS